MNSYNTLRDEDHLCHSALDRSTSTYVRRSIGKFSMRWAHDDLEKCNIDERGCSMTAWDLMEIVPSMPSFFYMAHFTAKPIDIPKFMIVSSVVNDSTYIKHTRNDKPNC